MTVRLEILNPSGTVALTPYLNVQRGEGMDPADPQFTNKIFAHSLLKQGGTLALEDLKLRELKFPLRLKGASKDALTLFVREINKAINASGSEVEWQDEGAAKPTFFSLASGQFDPEFDFRQGQQGQPMLKGMLRLFVQPLGQYEQQPRTFLLGGTEAAHGATVTGIAGVATFTGASPPLGDVAALMRVTIQGASSGGIFGVSVLPATGYQPMFLPASVTNTLGTEVALKATANAFGGTVARITPATAAQFQWSSANATLYAGPQRLLAVVRQGAGASVNYNRQLRAYSANQPYISASAAQASGNWSVADLGVLTLPSQALIENGIARFKLQLVAASAPFDFAGLIVLPDNSTAFWNAGQAASFAAYGAAPASIVTRVDGAANRWIVGEPNAAEEEHELRDVTGYARGAIPGIDPENGIPKLAVMALPWGASSYLSASFNYHVEVLERTRYVF